MADSRENLSKYLPLSPAAFHILLTLKSGDKHGYAILRQVAEDTRDKVKLLPGTLYNLLNRMLENGWINEVDERPDPELDDERRRYYRLSAVGEKVLTLESERLQDLVRAAQNKGLLLGREET